MAETHEQIVKVWIAPGCIVCDACETDCPEVFDVQEDTCYIRPPAKDAAFTKPLTPSIIIAAEGCPVDVIKYETVTVPGEAPWAGQEEEAAKAAAAAGGGAKPGGGGAKGGGWEPPEGPPDPMWAGLLADSHTSGSRSSGGPAVRMRKPAKAPAEAVAMSVPADAPPDAVGATAVGIGFQRPATSPTQNIRQRGERISRRAAIAVASGVSAALVVAWTSMGFVAATFAAALQAFMVPKVTKEPPSVFRAGKLSDYPEPGVYEQYKSSHGVWMVRLPEGKLVALSTTCTHLGCIPNWWPNDAKFKCPCHGSGFYMDGVNFEGPAPRPLERHKIWLEGEFVMVDKAFKYREELGQWESGDSFITL
jgi:cytochrome b6-f complex iron-sulfur subunit